MPPVVEDIKKRGSEGLGESPSGKIPCHTGMETRTLGVQREDLLAAPLPVPLLPTPPPHGKFFSAVIAADSQRLRQTRELGKGQWGVGVVSGGSGEGGGSPSLQTSWLSVPNI